MSIETLDEAYRRITREAIEQSVESIAAAMVARFGPVPHDPDEAYRAAFRDTVLEEAARVIDAFANRHARLQVAANSRRPPSKFPGPGQMIVSHGGLAGHYRDAAKAIRARKSSKGDGLK